MSSSSKGGESGIRINSTLIKKASGEVQDELSGLGVSVYNQDEFEAGVLEQLDREAKRRNAEQQRKFLYKEYSNIKAQIRTIQLELTTISKTIAGLLTQPLSSVVVRLRELKASQSAKRKQLESLEVRERTVLKRITSGESEDAYGEEEEGEGESGDMSFGLPLAMDGGKITEEQRLIQTGQLTPFGGQVQDSTSSNIQSSSAGSLSGTVELPTSSNSLPSTSATPNSLPVTPSAKATPTIQLSNDTFDGLFSDAVISKPKQKSASEESKSREKKGGVIEATTCNSHMDDQGALSAQEIMAQSSNLEQSMENGEWDNEEWMPDEAELAMFESEMLSSSESEYLTDEEMGTPQKKKRKRVLRELSSDEDDVGDHVTSKGRGRKRKRKQKHYQDDGDDELYRLRIWEYERERKRATLSAELEDKVFEGGLRIPGSIWHKLYRYQQTGVKWLWELHCQQAGGIVGDEMGLGKTIQMIAFLAGLNISNLRSHVTRELGLGPVLVVCPATVMHQWVSEFHTWWPPFRAAILHDTGSFGARDKKRLVDTIIRDCGVLITTYAGIRIYQDLLIGQKWDYVILDEGHKIRNPDAEITLSVKQFATPHRLILSGSPMQNNLKELWSLFDFVFPGKLGTLPVFMEQFSVPITQGGYANATEVQVQTAYRCACVLRDTINPYLLRRLKADVKIQLPDKNEQVLFCQLTDYQKEIYQDFLKSKEVEEMLAGQRQVFAGLTTLRKLCNHPDLVTNDYSQLVTPGNHKEGKRGSTHLAKSGAESATATAVNGDEEEEFVMVEAEQRADEDEGYGHWRRSGKMVVVESLLRLWREQGHRVLLFSQTKMMLDVLEGFVNRGGYTYRRMDGTTPISTRQPLINKFNMDPSIFVFLLTTRVGGLGVNLTGANRVILYDPDWNPSTDTQARERAWRIGQTRQVTVYRLLTSGTIEEKIYHRQIFKQFLTNRVLKDPRQRRFFKSNHLHELFTLDSSAVAGGSTETSALFAGTGSEILPPTKRRKRKKRRGGSESSDHGGTKGEAGLKRKRKKKNKSCDHDAAVSLDVGEGVSLNPIADQQAVASTSQEKEGKSGDQDAAIPLDGEASSSNHIPDQQAAVTSSSPEARKKEKKKRKKRRKRVTVDGAEIEGLERTDVFEPGRGDEEGASNQEQDDYILKKLFKKSGVHSAMQHDTIMSSANPDFVLVESEARKVAESAVKALKTSRRQCQQMVGRARRWGQPTWTGQHGSIGAPKPQRFGASSSSKPFASDKLKQQPCSSRQHSRVPSTPTHFAGELSGVSTTSSSETRRGSTNTSSNHLLAKIRTRNAHTYSRAELRSSSVQDIHSDSHGQLLSELRDFIATQCKTDGQATTAELLKHFSHKLPSSDTVLFKSLLHEICTFHRHLGEGLWSLKPEFR